MKRYEIRWADGFLVILFADSILDAYNQAVLFRPETANLYITSIVHKELRDMYPDVRNRNAVIQGKD